MAAEVNRPRKDMEMTPRKEIGCCRMGKGKRERRRQTWRKARREEGKAEKLKGSKRGKRLDRKCMNMYGMHGMDGVMVWKTERSDGE